MWKLTFDQKRHTTVIEEPSASDLSARIGALDNNDHTFVNLENDTGQIALSGGQDGKVMVHCTPDFERGFLVADPLISWDAGTLEMSIQGQRAEYSKRYFISKDSATQAAIYFFVNHSL